VSGRLRLRNEWRAPHDLITYRQGVLADCLAHPAVVQRLADVATDALGSSRKIGIDFLLIPGAPQPTSHGVDAYRRVFVAGPSAAPTTGRPR
jgi:hypothetical protein